MEIITKKLSELKLNPNNVRMHPDKQIKEYVRSLKQNGQLKPIVIDEHNVIWIGNGLFKAMREAGFEEAYCYVKYNLSDKQKKKMMLSDNRIFDLGVDDMAAFDRLIRDLGDDLDVPGYDHDLLSTLTADLDNVDTMMADYGIIDDERKEIIIEARENYERQEAKQAMTQQDLPQPAYETPSPTVSPAPLKEEAPQGRYVICPKCGETIWL